MASSLYLECASGISGDMTVAALLDLGANEDKLLEVLDGIPLDGFEVSISRVEKSGIDACDFDVKLDEQHENHDHDMDYLFGHNAASAAHDHAHGHKEAAEAEDAETGPSEKDEGSKKGKRRKKLRKQAKNAKVSESVPTDSISCAPAPHEHAHEHRTLPDVLEILDATPMSEGARAIAVKTFEYLAQAEARAHGVPVEQVRFHEVGAVDSIVDVISAAVCLDDLGVSEVIVPELCEGHGTVRCAHGILPVPVPATCAIALAARLPLRLVNVEGELVTPTGAAIAAAVRTTGELPARFCVKAVGLGAGKRAYENCSGILRAMLIEPLANSIAGAGAPSLDALRAQAAADAHEALVACGAYNAQSTGESLDAEACETVTKLECDLDDCTGEALGYVIARLLDAGAREAHFIPVYMKKDRPGYQLQVLCDASKVAELEQIIFEDTTTIGIRRIDMRRSVLDREVAVLKTAFGEIDAKRVTLPTGVVRTYPEYESVAQAARTAQVPYQDVYRAALAGEANEEA